MNRTSEFFTYLRREELKGPLRNQIRQAPNNYLQFSEASKEVRQRLMHARDSVHELFLKIRKGNIFGEDEERINEIIISLNHDLAQVETKISSLYNIKSKPQNYKDAIQTLQQNLSDITKDFQTLIKKRSEISTKIQERRQNITAPIHQSNYFPTMYNDETEVPMYQDTQVIQETRERYDLVRNVEQSITEIASMFQKLSQMIASQEYDVQRIDENANDASTNLLKGTKQLEKFYEKTKKNRWLIMKIGAVLIVFALIFILII